MAEQLTQAQYDGKVFGSGGIASHELVGWEWTGTVYVPKAIKGTAGALHVLEQGLPVGADVLRDVQKTLSGWRHFALPNSIAITSIKNGPGTYGGYRVLGAAGAGTVNLYDNPSLASGQKLERSGFTIAAAADLLLNPGIDFVNGLTVETLGTAPTAGLVLILWK